MNEGSEQAVAENGIDEDDQEMEAHKSKGNTAGLSEGGCLSEIDDGQEKQELKGNALLTTQKHKMAKFNVSLHFIEGFKHHDTAFSCICPPAHADWSDG